ncbi:hypothetical protein G1C96_1912 [Bifidobacterium sp. DSM 109958]|uniref:Uncharacterized protein n=1 Tax=Bifidobacterium moraviense TaxID=2675323 RepID=A0A7Y0F3G0_9BIFI|nr:hypothetical protein [Bifidobacterium sp. DSM 109958]NMN01323.1 hypothetical protein [Bifidobacterium sp. DSM 109958]
MEHTGLYATGLALALGAWIYVETQPITAALFIFAALAVVTCANRDHRKEGDRR